MSRKVRKWSLVVLCFLLFIPIAQVICLKCINPFATVPMFSRVVARRFTSGARAPIDYRWLQFRSLPRDFLVCVWLSEDLRFFEHHGFDWEEIERARQEARMTGQPARGASTITQQCARSLFLWQGRSWFRKGLEAYYTCLMELFLSKQRIFELYANVIELGDGVYGIEAAAQYYYHIPAQQLDLDQAAMLVAIMPNPRLWNPLRPTDRVMRRQAFIFDMAQIKMSDSHLAQWIK